MSTLFPIPSLSPFDQDVPGLRALLGDLSLMFAYCAATDVFVSAALEAQRPAKDYLKDLFLACNCAPVFSEGVLKSIPWSEMSVVGNGIVYNAPTATGPIFDFTPDHFIVKSAGAPPLKITRPRLFDVPNVVSVQFINRNKEYNDDSAMASDAALINQYGPIRGEPFKSDWITDRDLAARVAQLLLWAGDPTSGSGGGTISRLRYAFVLPVHFGGLYEPMDLVTVTDLSQGIYRRPVRLLSLKEVDDMTYEVEAEDFIYGAHASPGPPVSDSVLTTTSTGIPPANADPGSVAAPIIFEAVPALQPAGASGPTLVIAVAGPGPNYGGCHIWMSTDGGQSYGAAPVAAVAGNPAMGASSSDLPVGPDPDLTDSVGVNLAVSGGQLVGFTQTQEDLLLSLCYLAGGGFTLLGGLSADVPYELFAYQVATLVSAATYTLGTRLRRGLDSSPVADHPPGSAFVFLGDPHVQKLQLTPAMVGMRLWFKFTAFNHTGGTEQSLASVVAYSFTVTGLLAAPVAADAATFQPPVPAEPMADTDIGGWVGDASGH